MHSYTSPLHIAVCVKCGWGQPEQGHERPFLEECLVSFTEESIELGSTHCTEWLDVSQYEELCKIATKGFVRRSVHQGV